MDDMDDFLNKLEEEIKNEASAADLSAAASAADLQSTEKSSDHVKGRRKSLEVEASLEANVEPSLLASPILNIVQNAPTETATSAHNEFPRLASTSSIQEEDEEEDVHCDPDQQQFFAGRHLQRHQSAQLLPPTEHEFLRHSSTQSILDEGEMDEDATVKSLHLLDDEADFRCDTPDAALHNTLTEQASEKDMTSTSLSVKIDDNPPNVHDDLTPTLPKSKIFEVGIDYEDEVSEIQDSTSDKNLPGLDVCKANDELVEQKTPQQGDVGPSEHHGDANQEGTQLTKVVDDHEPHVFHDTEPPQPDDLALTADEESELAALELELKEKGLLDDDQVDAVGEPQPTREETVSQETEGELQKSHGVGVTERPPNENCGVSEQKRATDQSHQEVREEAKADIPPYAGDSVDSGGPEGHEQHEQVPSVELADLNDDEVLEMEAHGDDEESSLSMSNPSLDSAGSEPSTSQGTRIAAPRRSVVLSEHVVGNVGTDMRLTESELVLGKYKPIWLPDGDVKCCMLCFAKYTFLNRRHHCRACGRVLCAKCCKEFRRLAYCAEQKPQRICVNCVATLDKIEAHEAGLRQTLADAAAGESAGPSAIASPTGSEITRKKSLLKVRKADGEDATASRPAEPKASSVRFIDGTSPGSVQAAEDYKESKPPKARGCRLFQRPSMRRNREMMAADEARNLIREGHLLTAHDHLNVDLQPVQPAELHADFDNHRPIRLLMRRNIHVRLQLVDDGPRPFVCLYTEGLCTLGVEELLVAYRPAAADHAPAPPMGLVNAVAEFTKDMLRGMDDKPNEDQGVRNVALRINPCLQLEPQEKTDLPEDVFGLYFAPYMDQDLTAIPHPGRTFRVGVFIKSSEVFMFRAAPNRILFQLGFETEDFPYPIVNVLDRLPIYADRDTHENSWSDTTTLLSMFHDFSLAARYRLPYVAGCTVEYRDQNHATIAIPTWSYNAVKSVIRMHASTMAWSADLSPDADSALCCAPRDDARLLSTRVFSRGGRRQRTGAVFVSIGSGFRQTADGLEMAVVEDGLSLNLSQEAFDRLQRQLAAQEDVVLAAHGTTLTVEWRARAQVRAFGAIPSPVNGEDLRVAVSKVRFPKITDPELQGYQQYGLSMERIVNSHYFFGRVRTHAMRLGSAISLKAAPIEPQHRSTFFDVCEQMGAQIAALAEDFVHALVGVGVAEVCIRVHLSPDNTGFDLAPWPGLDNENEIFNTRLMENFLSTIMQIERNAPDDFSVELHLPFLAMPTLPKFQFHFLDRPREDEEPQKAAEDKDDPQSEDRSPPGPSRQ